MEVEEAPTATKAQAAEPSPAETEATMGTDSSSMATDSSMGTESFLPEVPEFPWPAPNPSAYYIVPSQLFDKSHTLGEVAHLLDAALEKSGYTERKFFRIKTDGFALVTRLESIFPDGRSRPLPSRWEVNAPPASSLSDYLQALLFAKRGLYRVWVFAETSSKASFGKPVPEKTVNQWLVDGNLGLPKQIEEISVTKSYACLALVYEFERKDSPPEPNLVLPSSLTGLQHLRAAGIIANLGK